MEITHRIVLGLISLLGATIVTGVKIHMHWCYLKKADANLSLMYRSYWDYKRKNVFNKAAIPFETMLELPFFASIHKDTDTHLNQMAIKIRLLVFLAWALFVAGVLLVVMN